MIYLSTGFVFFLVMLFTMPSVARDIEDNGLRVKHLLLFVLFLPFTLVLAVLCVGAFIFGCIADLLKPFLDKRIL